MNLEPSPAEPSPDLFADPFADAREALDRGDYGTVLRLLEPLVSRHPPATPQGGQLQLLMATACMGQGNSAAALACCHQARRCADPALRLQARELLEVLEAPSLQRPREWSLTLPQLGETAPIAGSLRQRSRRAGPAGPPPPPPPPPVGPTRAPVGLAAVVLVLTLLTLLLAGCVEVRAELQFGAPGRLQLVEELSPAQGQSPGPWQRQFAGLLQELGLRPALASGRQGRVDRLEGRMQPAADTLETLAASATAAARLAGVSLPPPLWQWRETNWLVGVRQELALEFDLRDAGAVPGVALAVDLRPLRRQAVRWAVPEPVQVLPAVRDQPGPELRWPLRPGRLNQLQLRCWRWSPLGLGAVAIGLGLALVLLLAGLRRRLGFGWPELPA
ncbi:DUF3153 domain-containing protein [Cyanobium sp. CH-040]|uniref:DUF3153 domain-containing protein n=1 Tax=Cyanobium sp. CH-040 TaxID=2823708 RepID=UPI0020CB9F99|nr:DUF3153 domain-containing protein [Cyanobium sp. CH-040]MCP9928113.1 DUF3153 domain-containing protein [Cyanobium sp. CH-040]